MIVIVGCVIMSRNFASEVCLSQADVSNSMLSDHAMHEVWLGLHEPALIPGYPGGIVNMSVLKVNPVYKVDARSSVMTPGKLTIFLKNHDRVVTLRKSGNIVIKIEFDGKENVFNVCI